MVAEITLGFEGGGASLPGCGDRLPVVGLGGHSVRLVRYPHLSGAEKLVQGHSNIPNDLSQQDW